MPYGHIPASRNPPASDRLALSAFSVFCSAHKLLLTTVKQSRSWERTRRLWGQPPKQSVEIVSHSAETWRSLHLLARPHARRQSCISAASSRGFTSRGQHAARGSQPGMVPVKGQVQSSPRSESMSGSQLISIQCTHASSQRLRPPWFHCTLRQGTSIRGACREQGAAEAVAQSAVTGKPAGERA